MKKKAVDKPKYKQDGTTVVTSRIPDELVKDLDTLAEKEGKSRNTMIRIAISEIVESSSLGVSDRGV